MEDQTAQMQLIIEQLARMKDQINARIDRMEETIKHQAQLQDTRLVSVTGEIQSLRKMLDDHETRIRSVNDGVTSFKVFSGLASGGSSVLSVVSLLRALLP
jgi:predicted RNase H-like nuclease (RuvC/YqgF family)